MNVCLDSAGTTVSGNLESKNKDLMCKINAGGNEKGFTAKCGGKDAKARFTGE